LRSLGLCVLFALVGPGLARAAGPELGPLERGSVETALAARGLSIDPAPDGKIVGAVQVLNLDVFQPSDGSLLQWFNHFHRTTREGHLRRESLLQPGMAYDPLLVEETLRNLRNRASYAANDPPVTGIAAMVPVQATAPGTVDLLIVTRDVWSLRFNTGYDYQPGYLINLSTSLSENNLFGWRKQVAVAYTMTPMYMMVGPNYFDPNLLGTRLRLIAAFYEIWDRKLGEIAAGPHQGSSSRLRIEYPFYALANRWGGFVDGTNTSYLYRSIGGTDGKTLQWFNPDTSKCEPPPSQDYANPATGVDANAACAYHLHTAAIRSGVTRAVPRAWLVQRFTLGNEFGLVRPTLSPDFPDQLRAQYTSYRYYPVGERTSALYLQYDAFTPRYRTYRNLETYDLGEDQRLGPSVTMKFGRASTLLGSERDFFTFQTDAHVNLALGGGFQTVGASWRSRRYSEGWSDQLVKGELYAATPMLRGAVRLVASGTLGFMVDNQLRRFVYVGAVEGLRAYPVNAFLGQDYYLAHLELRSSALPVWSTRLGGVVFADAGDAADSWHQLGLFSDAGVGLRLLIPQLNVEPLRCDWAFAFQGYRTANGTLNPGWPGRLSCGFHQAF
jgi:hypothetical protein